MGDRQSDTSLSDDPMGQLGTASATVTGKLLPTPQEPAGLAQAQQRWHTMGMPSWEQGLYFPLRGPVGWTHCWVICQFYFQFFKESPHYSP